MVWEWYNPPVYKEKMLNIPIITRNLLTLCLNFTFLFFLRKIQVTLADIVLAVPFNEHFLILFNGNQFVSLLLGMRIKQSCSVYIKCACSVGQIRIVFLWKECNPTQSLLVSNIRAWQEIATERNSV